MRLRAQLLRIAFVSATALALAAACRSKGNGIGTAPPLTQCPATVAEGSPCSAVEVCTCAGVCGAASCDPDAGAADADAGPTVYLYCPGGTGATWVCVEGGDGGTFSDAEVGSEVDGDAGEAEVDGETDAADADAEETLDADAAETTADTAPEADAIVDEADAAVDADADADADAD